MDHRKSLDLLVDWATREDNVRAVVLTGSAALGGARFDGLSDLDVELYVRQPSGLLDERSWYEAFGEVLVVEALPNPGWHPTRLVYFVDGKIDFMVAPATTLGAATYTRPFRVLVDKDQLTEHLRVEPPTGTLPSEEVFLECAHWFYAAALMCAKCIVRGELWMAKRRDVDLKDELLRMIEWDHKARHGVDYDTWYLGVHMKEWMDEEVRDAVAETWSRFDAQDSARALSKTLPLFARFADRTAGNLGFTPFDHHRVQAEVTRILGLTE